MSEGILCELPFGTSEARFGLLKTERHYHFICDACHKIYDLPLAPRVELEKVIQRGTGHQVNRHTVEFYGRCSDCSHKTIPEPPQKRSPASDNPGRRGSPSAALKEKTHG